MLIKRSHFFYFMSFKIQIPFMSTNEAQDKILKNKCFVLLMENNNVVISSKKKKKNQEETR